MERIKRMKRVDLSSKMIILTFALSAIIALLLMFYFILKEAFPAFSKYGFFKMYFGAEFTKDAGYGIWGPLTVTLITATLATLIAIPLSLRTAFFIHFRMKTGKKIVKVFINILAGVPSVIFGAFALYSLSKFTNTFWDVKAATTMLNAIFMLAFMVMPTMVSLILNQLNTLDKEKLNASLALGNSRTYSMYSVVKREIRSGIYVAIIVALGRAIGETMAISFILAQIPNDYFENGVFNLFKEGFMPLGVYISKFFITDGNASKDYLFASGLALFVIVMILIICVTSLSKKRTISNVSPIEKINRLSKDKSAEGKLMLSYTIILFPFSMIRHYIISFMNLLRIAKEYLKEIILYPLHKILYRRRKNEESYTQYFTSNKTSFRSYKSNDYFKITLELISTFIVVGFSFWITFDVLIIGMKNWEAKDWTWSNWNESHTRKTASSIANPLIWTILFVLITIVIAFPFALLTALYLTEYARGKRHSKVIKFFLDSLGGTPSIVFGIFGSLFFVKTLHLASNMQFSLIAGSLTMLLVILPTFTRSIEQVLERIPQNIRDASYALGASKTRTIFKVVIPRSLSGIITGILLSAGRIVAETAPVYLTLGAVITNTNVDIMGPGHTLTTEILGLFWTSNGSTIEDMKVPAYKLGAAAILLTTSLAILGESVEPLMNRIKKLKLSKAKKGIYA